MRIRVGIIGLGDDWDRWRRPALKALSDRFEVRAVCAEVAAKAAHAGRGFGASVTHGYRALLARKDIDAVLLLAPQWYGPLPIYAACDHGKDVYCATAVDIDPDECLMLRRRVDAAGITFMSEFPRRVAPATLRLKELIATCLGQPRLLFCHRRLALEDGADSPRHGACASPRRELLETIDWLRYLVGSDPTSVTSVRQQVWPGERSDDYRMMSLDFSPAHCPGAAALAQLSCGHYLPKTWPEAITFRPPAALHVVCERGAAFLDLPATLVWFDEAGRHVESLDHERPVGELLLAHFYRAVTSLVRKPSGIDDACRALGILAAADQSAAEGRRISLEEASAV